MKCICEHPRRAHDEEDLCTKCECPAFTPERGVTRGKSRTPAGRVTPPARRGEIRVTGL